ncbi:MAG: helix-turn-helix transcriptional regulator [Bacteroidetes bacterium]|jgi:AraC-like DNA-binding protein|nr:helix-turn-helix transcriptional regulator [Bacteroidota bacterium]MDF1865014.1 helix-turn-helix transcriptional regulator [Saprospiraceae bacterium]
MSHSQLHRKLTALIGLSPNKFIRHVRLSKAKKLLLNSETNITRIAYETGFNDPGYFGRMFKKEFGVTPIE